MRSQVVSLKASLMTTVCVIIFALAVGASASIASAKPSAQGHISRGGSLTALESSSFIGMWTSLDPATDLDSSSNATMMNAIYGELFVQSATGALKGDLATGYKVSKDAMTADIYLRHGVTFQDGTPFNSSAVVYNIQRDLEPQYTCICAKNMPIASVKASGPYTVVLNLKTPYPPIINAFVSEAPDWIASPTALQREGTTEFGKMPVGAGPFKVVSDTPNSEIKLTRNPHYWQKGEPYLNNLTFLSIGSDASAVDALQTGQAQIYENLVPVLVTPGQQQQVTVYNPAALSVAFVQFNTLAAPFNNPLAREAISYATDPGPILKNIYQGKGSLTQSPTGPGGLFYEPKVPGYRTYDLAKAKALVKQLGGLKVSLSVVSSTLFNASAEALESQWHQAGIDVSLDETTLTGFTQEVKSNAWQAHLGTVGSYDPALIPGVSFKFTSEGAGGSSGVNDPKLNQLLNSAATATSVSKRASLYRQSFKYMAAQSDGVFLFSYDGALLTTKNVRGVSSSDLLGSIEWGSVSLAG